MHGLGVASRLSGGGIFASADKGRGAALRLSPQRFFLPDGKTLRVITVFYWISYVFLSL